MLRRHVISFGYTCLLQLLLNSTAAETPPGEAADQPTLGAREEVLGEKSSATDPQDEEDIASPDGHRVAWRDKRGKKWVARVNGEDKGAEYDQVEWIIFSPDSQHLAYRAKQGQTWMVVVDGEPGFPYQEVGAIAFSPDGQHLAYAAKKGKQWLTVRDGVEGPAYDEVGLPRFSPDSQHLVYPAKRRKKWVMVIDKEEQGPEMDQGYESLGFTPNKQEPVYVGWTKKGGAVFRAGQPGPEFDIIGRPVFYSSQDRLAYSGARIEKPFMKAERAFGQVIVDSAAGPVYEGQPVESGVVAVGAALGGGPEKSLIKGVRPRLSARSHGVSSPTMSPDGEHIAYAARRGDGDYIVLLDDEPGPSFKRNACNPAFSPDGKLFYVGVEEEKLVLVVNGTATKEFAWKGIDACSNFLFTPDSAHFAYAALQGGGSFETGYTSRAKRRVFLDGEAGKEYDAKGLTDLTLFPGTHETHLSYAVHDVEESGRDVSFVVLDGQEGKRYDSVMPDSLRFSDERTVTFLARRERTFLRVTHSLP